MFTVWFRSPNAYLVLCQDGQIRLSGGQSPTEGRVEICFNNQWGTVCDDFWDARDATVVCTQLGLPSEGKLVSLVKVCSFDKRVDIIWFCLEGAAATTVRQGIGHIFLDNVICTGNESRLADCLHQGIASHDCSHSEDAGVVCSGEYFNTHIPRLRLGPPVLLWETLARPTPDAKSNTQLQEHWLCPSNCGVCTQSPTNCTNTLTYILLWQDWSIIIADIFP